MFSFLHRLVHWLGVKGEAWMKKREAVEVLDSKIESLYLNSRSLSGCLVFSFLGWLTTAIEAYFFLWAMGTPVDLATAIEIQALVLGVRAATFFVPGNLGAQEGGNVLIFMGLGMGGDVAMAFSLLRRARQVAWILVGLAILTRYGWGEFESPAEMEAES